MILPERAKKSGSGKLRTTSRIPSGSLVEKYLPADYSDAFSYEATEATTGKPLTADDIMVAFWTGRTGGWVRALFRLRDFLVRFVGLQGGDRGDPAAFERCIREGGSYRFVSVSAKNDRETVLLLSDKHLDAWMSILIADRRGDSGRDVRKTVFAITVVKFHNRLGRIYFFLIRPFHAAIVKNMLEKAVGEV